jgi:hypothetical protein
MKYNASKIVRQAKQPHTDRLADKTTQRIEMTDTMIDIILQARIKLIDSRNGKQ